MFIIHAVLSFDPRNFSLQLITVNTGLKIFISAHPGLSNNKKRWEKYVCKNVRGKATK